MIAAKDVIDQGMALGPGWVRRPHTDHFVYVGLDLGTGDRSVIWEGKCEQHQPTRETAGISGLPEARSTGDLQEQDMSRCVVLPVAGAGR